MLFNLSPREVVEPPRSFSTKSLLWSDESHQMVWEVEGT
ncbi:hypothetical protein RSAG8_13993, partial [Rhizoctonia solani AG-8 WAC10335]